MVFLRSFYIMSVFNILTTGVNRSICSMTLSKYINNDKLIRKYCLIKYEYVIVACLSTEYNAKTMFFISQKELFKSKLSFLIYNDFSTFYSSFFRSLNTIVFKTVGTLPMKTVFPPPIHNVGPYKSINQQWAVVYTNANIDFGKGGFYP